MPQILMSKCPDGTSEIVPIVPSASTSNPPLISSNNSLYYEIIRMIEIDWGKIRDKYFQDIDNFKEQQRQEFKFQNRVIKKNKPRARELRMNRRRSCIQGHGKAGRV